ncbi:mitochondrial carrier protein [Nitzschia inconspicua]|uniref:ADP/ATP translocase n=1 Tax=Nitzschia inconspicua TaxID=303405 RepID=A0A9K3PXC2_9STRA|nr:mitochondrial carrier protein [Nitzschia inconspicua]
MNDSIVEVAAGAASGALSKTIMAPLDRLKLVVQLRSELSSKDAREAYKGPWRSLQKIFKEESFLALWRGNTPTVLIQAGTSGMNFCFMDLFKKAAVDVFGEEQRFAQSFASAALGGATAITVFYPLGLMRTKLALDMGNDPREYPRGMRDVASKSVQSNGITSLFQGYGVALVSVTVYRMIHLGGYDYAKSELQRRQSFSSEYNFKQLPLWQRVAVAQLVSVAATTFHYPFDSVRRRLMMQSDASKKRYANALDCTQQIFRNEGIRGFYQGLGTSYIRSVGAALLLLSYDFFKSILISQR